MASIFKQSFDELKRIVPRIIFARPDEVKKYLEKYGLDIDEEEYRCVICGERVTSKNLGIIINGEKIKVVCNKPKCMNKANIFSLYRENK